MAPHSSSVSKLEDPEDLLLSYLNADCLDTTNATTPALDMINTNPSLSPSSTSFDGPFSPHANYPSPWSSIPFLFNVNALASACMESPDLTAGISPCSISRFGSPSSPDVRPSITYFTPNYATVSQLADIKDDQPPTVTVPLPSSASSPTISTTTSISSSDTDEPKRKRERKKQQQQHGSPPAMMHNCKPILPAATQHHHLTSPPPACSLVHVKSEPIDLNTASVLTTLDNSSNSNRCETTIITAGNRHASSNNKRQAHGSGKPNGTRQQQSTVSATDAHNKRQERLIKNRAAALLSRKRKREHLQALEHERQWLSKDNDILISKTAALEAKVHMLEKENRHQQQQYLLLERQLQQQQQRFCKDRPLDSYECNNTKDSGGDEDDDDDDDTTLAISMQQSSHPMDPISKVTNVLMILFISFALLTLPVTSDRQLTINKDKDTPSAAFISSNNTNEKNMSNLYLPLVLQQQQQQQQQHLLQSTDETMDMDKESALDCQHTPPLHRLKPDQDSTAASMDHTHLSPSPISIRKRKRDIPEVDSDPLPL